MKKLRAFAAAFMVLNFAVSNLFAEKMSIEQYLNEVSKNNLELKSIQSSIDAVRGKLAEAERVYSYYFTVGAEFGNDEASKTSQTNYNLGINKMFTTGTQVSVIFGGARNSYKLSYSNQTENDLNSVSPFIQVEQSLLKNINGAATKASVAKAVSNARSALYNLTYQKQAILLNSKLAYWNLSYSRRAIEFRKASLERSQKILDWNTKRYKVDLAEKSDLLQSQAAVKMRELNLKVAFENENRVDRQFKQFLNINDNAANYDIKKFEEKPSLLAFSLKKNGTRYDVLAALEDVKTADYDRIISNKNSGADLVLTGKLGFSDTGVDVYKPASASLNGDGTNYTFGVKYSLPLDFSIRASMNSGYEWAKEAASQKAGSLKLSEQNDWSQLVDDWNNAKIRFELCSEINKIQKNRNEEDKSLLRKGRSTTYLVLQSEEDLDSAELNYLESTLELIRLREQAEAFYNNNE
jgi:outer membrane protein TolC